MSRGQATLEFMFMFLALVAFISILVGALIVAKNRAVEQTDVLEHTLMMEEKARALEVYSNNGLIMIFDIGHEIYLVEGDVIKVDYKNKTIIVEGIFKNDPIHKEPI
jgi:uncharacterized protein (UPF0333 family)